MCIRDRAQADPNGKYRERRVNLLELKAGMVRILPPDAIRLQRILLNFLRKPGLQLPKRFSRVRGHCPFRTATSFPRYTPTPLPRPSAPACPANQQTARPSGIRMQSLRESKRLSPPVPFRAGRRLFESLFPATRS